MSILKGGLYMSKKRKIDEIREEERKKAEAEAAKKAEAETGASASASASGPAVAFKTPSKDDLSSKAGKHETTPTAAEVLNLLKSLGEETARFQKETIHFQKVTNEKLLNHEDRIIALERDAGLTPIEEPEPEPVVAPAPVSEPSGTDGVNGVGKAYRYWNAITRTWKLSSDIWAAKQASNGVYDIIWVMYKNGSIDHILSEEEIRAYTPC